MNRAAIFATALLGFTSAFAQSSTAAENFIAARQVEVNGLAESLYFTHLGNRWMRRTVPQCEVFKHHAFAIFDTGSAKEPHFAAIYDLDHAAARSADKPWEGGVTLLRLNSHLDAVSAFDALITAFNRAAMQESAAGTTTMMAADKAICLIHIAGEQPAEISPGPVYADGQPATPVKIASILVPLVSSANARRSAMVQFAPDGSVSAFTVIELPLPKP